jgi:hypothetical protein
MHDEESITMLDGVHLKNNKYIFIRPMPGPKAWKFNLSSFVEVVSVYIFTEE